MANLRRPWSVGSAADVPPQGQSIAFGALDGRIDHESAQHRVETKRRRDQRAVVGIFRIISTEELRIQAESLRCDVQGGQIERLQLVLVGWRVHVGELERRVEVELDRTIVADLDIFGQRLAPFGILQFDSISVVMPVLPAFLAVSLKHVLVRGRIVRGHRRTIGVVRVKISTARINLDAIVGRAPPRIFVSLLDNAVSFSISVKSMLCAGTPACGYQDAYKQHSHHKRRKSVR